MGLYILGIISDSTAIELHDISFEINMRYVVVILVETEMHFIASMIKDMCCHYTYIISYENQSMLSLCAI